MKKTSLSLSTLALTLTLTFSSFSSQNANAAFMVNPLAGIAAGGLGIFLIDLSNHQAPSLAMFTNFFTGAFFFMLDKESNTVKFNSIDSDMAQKMGLTTDEFHAFNNELDTINLSIEEAVALNNSETGKAYFKDSISSEAYSAVVKLVSAK